MPNREPSAPQRLLRFGARQLTRAKRLPFPRRCPFCGEVLGSILECTACEEELRRLEHGPSRMLSPQEMNLGCLDGAASAYRYEGIVREGILCAKMNGAGWAGEAMGRIMAEKLLGSERTMRWGLPGVGLSPMANLGIGYQLVVPVPDSGRGRGYNLPTEMAKPLAEALNIPLEAKALHRTGNNRHQTGLSRMERVLNAAGSYAADPKLDLEGKSILLVDDVITTGATVSACAHALLLAGADNVFAVSLARTSNAHE